MKAIGFNQGQYGDLCINLIACRAFKNKYPKSQLYFGINKRYMGLMPIFLYNNLIDDIYVWENYDNWPSKNDIQFIREQEFDIVFNTMPHLEPGWQTQMHQTEKVCYAHGLNPPTNLQIEFNHYFGTFEGMNNHIAICHTGTTDNYKKGLSYRRVIEIAKLITSLGCKPLFFQTKIENYDCFNDNFFNAIKAMLSCKMLITIDSAMSWIASGYKFPTLGLYNRNYYIEAGATTSKNWQPINPNATYIEDHDVNNIDLNLIKTAVKNHI